MPSATILAQVGREGDAQGIEGFQEHRVSQRPEFQHRSAVGGDNLNLGKLREVGNVFKVHPTFHKRLSKSLRQPTKGDGHFLHNHFWEEDTRPFVSTDPSDPALPPVSRLNESGLRKSVFGVLFPNSAVNIHGTDVQFTHLEPLAPNHTRMHRYFYFIGKAATTADYLRARQRTYEAWTALLQEDVGVCERAQEGRRCNAYDGGRFAPSWDSAAHYFHRLVADVIASETNHHPT